MPTFNESPDYQESNLRKHTRSATRPALSLVYSASRAATTSSNDPIPHKPETIVSLGPMRLSKTPGEYGQLIEPFDGVFEYAQGDAFDEDDYTQANTAQKDIVRQTPTLVSPRPITTVASRIRLRHIELNQKRYRPSRAFKPAKTALAPFLEQKVWWALTAAPLWPGVTVGQAIEQYLEIVSNPELLKVPALVERASAYYFALGDLCITMVEPTHYLNQEGDYLISIEQPHFLDDVCPQIAGLLG